MTMAEQQQISNNLEELLPGKVFSMKNFLSQSECESLIKQSEAKGFKRATISVPTSLKEKKKDQEKEEGKSVVDVKNFKKIQKF